MGYSIHVPKSLAFIIRTLPEAVYVERDSKVWINNPYFAAKTLPANKHKASNLKFSSLNSTPLRTELV
ncbi:hypothetical protein PPACK8108_LOCUS21099 [Phakopsora pachyrhizi]|uniref:Uncharacterized protein n=1 Tax=Phakopsora pachyrhizi TaxID=170000 RepID=A0AAV0BHT9_PHAPC|nr:hypothetical protein PPACK8108_LOCUS21099 [Phakopsora pachyrhizi]